MRNLFAVSMFMVSMFIASSTVLADLNDGLVAYYPFNGNANDESGNGNHGTVIAAIDADGFNNVGSVSEFNNRAVKTGQLPKGDYRISIASGAIALCGGSCNITAISFRVGEDEPIFDLGVLAGHQQPERYWDEVQRTPQEAFDAYLSSGNTSQDVTLKAPAELFSTSSTTSQETSALTTAVLWWSV